MRWCPLHERALGPCADAAFAIALIAVYIWYFGKPPTPYRVVQACSGFRCGDCTTKLAKKLARAAGHRTNYATASGPARHAHVATTIGVSVGATAIVVALLLRSAARNAFSDLPPSQDAGYARPRVTSFRSKAGKGGMLRPGERRIHIQERTPLLSDD